MSPLIRPWTGSQTSPQNSPPLSPTHLRPPPLPRRFMAFDKHMNLVLGDCEEFRRMPPKKGGEEQTHRRALGLVLLRGEEVVTVAVEAPPPNEGAVQRAQVAPKGPGAGQPAGRGMPMPAPGQAAPGLAGPVRGMGGPAPGRMQPRPSRAAPPMPFPGAPPGMPPPGMPPPGRPPPGMAPPGMPPPGMMPPGGPPGGMPMPPGPGGPRPPM